MLKGESAFAFAFATAEANILDCIISGCYTYHLLHQCWCVDKAGGPKSPLMATSDCLPSHLTRDGRAMRMFSEYNLEYHYWASAASPL